MTGSTSVGLTWGTGFLLLQPVIGFFIAYSMKLAQPENPAQPELFTGSYDRLTSGGTSNLSVHQPGVGGWAVRAVERRHVHGSRTASGSGRSRANKVLRAMLAAVAGLYSISPFASVPYESPFFYLRYIAILIMVLATLGAFITYMRGRLRFRYGSPGTLYRVILLALGALAATVIALNMGLMKSNSRVPYTVYNQPDYNVEGSPPPDGFGRVNEGAKAPETL